jgi:hypothetical protein
MKAAESERDGWWGGMTRLRKSPGPRLNGLDLIILAAFVAASVTMAGLKLPFFLLPAWICISFLVFCNIVRIRRNYELAWCAITIAGTFSLLFLRFDPKETGLIIAIIGSVAQGALIALARRNGHLNGIGRRNW